MMISKDDAIRQWGEEGMLRFRLDAVGGLNMPLDVKTALSEMGIPCEVDPFFYTTNVEETRVLTLGEYAQSVGAPAPDRGDDYYRVGTDYGTEICLAKGSGEVVSIDMRGELPERFVNSSIAQFVTFLYVVDRERAQFLGLSDEEIDRRVLLGRAGAGPPRPQGFAGCRELVGGYHRAVECLTVAGQTRQGMCA